MTLLPKRGDIYVADLGQGVGSEQANERPVVIVQNNKGNAYADTTIIVPITSRMKNDIPNHVIIHYGMFVKFSQYAKADSPIFVTLSVMITLVRFLHPLKA